MKVSVISKDITNCFSALEDGVKEIRNVYVYDPQSCTYLCEMIPSYALRYLYTYIVFLDISEERKEKLTEKYCYQDMEDDHMHVSDVRQFVKDAPDCHKEFDFDSFDDAWEHLISNMPF